MSACSANFPAAPLPPAAQQQVPDGAFVMNDGARLPYRTWLPPGRPRIVVLALHGFNDSFDGWEIPAPKLVQAGIAVIAPDQRGFGGAPERGRWPGTQRLASDTAAMARQLIARFPQTPVYLMGESMGGAILLEVATMKDAPPVAGYVLIAPAVWGWSQMNLVLRASLWLTNSVAPGLLLDNGPIRVTASDNRAALIRLAEDPRTLLRSRVAAVKGLVDLMDTALKASPEMTAPALVMYGGCDELVPKHAMAAAWQGLVASDPSARLAYYPHGYHLLLRDLERGQRINDLIAWLDDPRAPLPSGADHSAQAWLAYRLKTAGLPSVHKSG